MDIFVVTHPTVTERNENMRRRLAYFNLLDRTHFIYGEDRNSVLAQHYVYGATSNINQIACLLGHLKALRAFVETDTPYGCILEDDVLLHNNFKELLDTMTIDEDIELVQLYTMSRQTQNITRYGVWGAQGYIIKREYAISCLQKYDKPLAYWDKGIFQASEAILIYSKGIISEKFLVIEDMMATTIGLDEDPRGDRHIYDHIVPGYELGLHNYIDCDDQYSLDSYYIPYAHHTLIRHDLNPGDLKCILDRIRGPATADQTLYIAALYMLCEFYLDRESAERWADIYYYILDNFPMEKIVEEAYFIKYIQQFYQRK